VSQAVGVRYDFVDVFGTKGRVRGDWPDDIVTVQSQVIPDYLYPATLRIDGDNIREMFYREMTAFVEAVIAGHPSPIPVDDGLRVLRILDAVVASSDSENWVYLRK
jgi:predicted dehydrogenase